MPQNIREVILAEMEEYVYTKDETVPNGPDSSDDDGETEAFAVLSHGIQALQVLHRPDKKNEGENCKPPASISALRSHLKSELALMIERALAEEKNQLRSKGLTEIAAVEDQSVVKFSKVL